MALGKQIKHYREKLGWKLEQLSFLSGVEVGTISALENRDSTRSKFGPPIAKAFGLTMEQLLDESTSHATDKAPTNIEPAPAGAVPVVSWVQAGNWCGSADTLEPADTLQWLPCPIRHGPRTYALIVRGVSMYNPAGNYSFKDGDTIFVDPDRQADHRSLVIARLDHEKEATFKQLLIEGEQRMLQALNPSWPDRIIRINGNCTLSGVVIGKVEFFI